MKNIIKTIPNTSPVDIVKFYPRYSTLCRIGNAPFYGFIEIEYEPSNSLLEFESFEEWLRSLSNERMTIEELCRLTFDRLSAVLGDIRLSVTVHAETTVHAPASATIKRKGEQNG